MRDEREQQAQDPGTQHDEPTTDGPAEEDEECNLCPDPRGIEPAERGGPPRRRHARVGPTPLG